jgi:hypothetical protein
VVKPLKLQRSPGGLSDQEWSGLVPVVMKDVTKSLMPPRGVGSQYSDAKLRCRLPVLWLMKEASAQYRKPFKQHLAVTEKLLNLVKEVMVLGQRSN